MRKSRSNSFNTTINIISSLGVMIINMCISFFLSPYIINKVGVEANGFVTLANNFVTCADLIVTALNAMAARFITIAYVKKDYKEANLYYNSVFWGNLIIVIALIIPSTYLIVSLERFIDIPSDILLDVKVLFSMAFFSFFIKTGAPNWDCGTYVTNRLDRTYIPSIFSSLFRCVFLFCIFSVLYPHVWYVSLSSAIITIFTLMVAWFNTHSLTPELKIKIDRPLCSLKVIAVLVGSGIWNSITIAGNMLLSGLDLLVCNLSLGATSMGVLSISKTLPSILTNFSESIRGAFGPELTITYAKGDKEVLYNVIGRSMKISAVVVSIPVAGIIVMSDTFYSLWLPSQDAQLLQILTSLAILASVLSSGITPLNNVFTTVNKVKYNSLALIITGLVSIISTLLIIRFTDYDLYAVAGVSSVVMIIRDLVFTVPVTARLLGFKWYKFYPRVGISLLSCGLLIIVGSIIKYLIPIQNWISFFLVCALISFLGLVLNMRLVLNKEERRYLVEIVRQKIKI